MIAGKYIEDVDPERTQQNLARTSFQSPMEDASEGNAFDPGSIIVSGAVMVAYKIKSAGTPAT